MVNLLHLSAEDRTLFDKAMKQARHPFVPVTLFYELSEEQIAVLAVNEFRLPGIDVEPQFVRHCPMGAHFAHSIGYVGRFNEKESKALNMVEYRGTQSIGKTGIEKFYESELHGHVGYEEVETNAQRRVLRVLKHTDPVPKWWRSNRVSSATTGRESWSSTVTMRCSSVSPRPSIQKLSSRDRKRRGRRSRRRARGVADHGCLAARSGRPPEAAIRRTEQNDGRPSRLRIKVSSRWFPNIQHVLAGYSIAANITSTESPLSAGFVWCREPSSIVANCDNQ